MPGEHTLALRRQISCRSQLVGRRTQLKNEIRAVLPAHLIDPAPARHGHIIKRGRSYTRAMLVEAAWGAA